MGITIKVAHNHCFDTSRNKQRKWVAPVVGFCSCSVFCCAFLCVHSGFAIILMGKEELAALLSLSSCVSWLFCCSSSRCHGFVCSLCLWYFLIILTYDIKCASFAFNFSCFSNQTCFVEYMAIRGLTIKQSSCRKLLGKLVYNLAQMVFAWPSPNSVQMFLVYSKTWVLAGGVSFSYAI